MKHYKGAVLAFAAAIGVATPVFAASSGTFSLSTTGVAFSSGSYRFGARSGCVPTGFSYSGNLKDTAADGNAVFVHAKAYRTGYATRVSNSKGNGTSKSVSQTVTQPGDCWVDEATVQACQDRGSAFPDLCTSKKFSRF